LGRLAARFPGWQANEETFLDWSAKILQFPADVTWKVVDRLTATSTSPWPPPLGEIRLEVLKDLERIEPKKLPEPEPSWETRQAGVRAILDAIDGKRGPLVRDLKRAAGGDDD
jgi:hypothetical protein